MVRSALIWLGNDDPVATMETARGEDPDLQMLRAVVAAWKEAVGVNNPLTTGGLKLFADKEEVSSSGGYSRPLQRRNMPSPISTRLCST